MNGVEAPESAERAQEEIRRLRERVLELEGRIRELETAEPPGTRREFGPARLPADTRRHQSAVKRALEMLGLAPEMPRPMPPAPAEMREPAAGGPDASRTLAALERARSFFGKPARRIAPVAPPPEAFAAAFAGVPAAAPPESPVAAPPEAPAEAGAAEPFVPPPELTVPAPLEPRPRAEREPLPIGDAMELPLGREGDVGERLLTAAVFLAALGGAGVAFAQLPLFGEVLAAFATLLFASVALFAPNASIHLRAVAAGGAAFAGNLLLLDRLGAAGPFSWPAALAAGTVLGAIAARTRHPLAPLVGFAGPLVLGYALPAPAPFVVAALLGCGIGALRARRLQPSIAAALLASPLLLEAGPSIAVAGATLLFAQAVAEPFLARRPSSATAILALIAMALFAAAVHALPFGSLADETAALVLGGAAAALCAAAVPQGERLLRGALKAGAILLLLSILPVGFEGRTLAAASLVVAFVLSVFALFFSDGVLRSAAAIVLLLALGVLAAAGPTPWGCLWASGVAAILFAVRVPGSRAPMLRALLGTIALASGLGAFPGVLPDAVVPAAWLVLSLLLSLAGLAPGGLLYAAAAAAWLLWQRPRDATHAQILFAAVALAATSALFRLRGRGEVTYPEDAAGPG